LKILTLLLHDERFSGWTVRDKVFRRHFSIQCLRFCKSNGWEPLLYTFHQNVEAKKVYRLHDGIVKVFPVKFRFPPFQRFGNDHNPEEVMDEALRDSPDLVHFHHYYLFSFPYTAFFVKEKLKRPLAVQLHGYNNGFVRKWLYTPCILSLKKADVIVYSYKPEEALYHKLGLNERAVRIPFPGVNPEFFKRKRKTESSRLLYVGRVPKPERAFGEKSPYNLLYLLRRLLALNGHVFLDVVGDGPGLPHCKGLARLLGVEDHVAFHGYVPHFEVFRYYQAAALTIVPIQVYDVDGWFDGSIQESLACGTPVAAFKASPKVGFQGTYGFMLSKDLAKAAEEVFTILKSPERAYEMADEGSRFVHEMCTHEKVALKLREVWEAAVKR
jgi:glycosyltransferase involved in cell wall biosynthesis